MARIPSFPIAALFKSKTFAPRARDYRVLREIRSRVNELSKLADSEIPKAADKLRSVSSDELQRLEVNAVVDAFALATEALRRVTGKVYYDVQLLGGLVLSTGCIAEMQTGEGKTITCGLPAVLFGLLGNGVHVATTNAYLAERDYEELLPVMEMLGLTSARIFSDQPAHEKKAAYDADVTYGTGYEFGFDFLRDQVAMRNRPKYALGTQFLARLRGLRTFDVTLTQRQLYFSIIDEADSVLIDEAGKTLIMSSGKGAARPDPEIYLHAMSVANDLTEGQDFTIDEIDTQIELTDEGWGTIHKRLTPKMQKRLKRPWSQYVEQALRVRLVLVRDVDYIVRDNQIVFVDQNTGRLHDERKWRSGLHQSIETREGVPLSEEREIEARITRQRYFRFYDRVSGMTGTAEGNEAELAEFYRLPVVQIPRNKPSRRIHLPSRFFGGREAKYDAIAEDVRKRQEFGQPVLIGTLSVNQSVELASILEENGIEHTLLNGTQDESEANLISHAGEAGRVMIATNMAGRGTDIRLSDEAKIAGGLHVIAVEHQESPRVDRQLIGRCARQNDPGSCQFFVSANDEIINRYDKPLAKSIARSSQKTGESTTSFEGNIQRLQARIEKIKFDARRKMVVHDKWMESVQESVAKLA